jgi:hypothetical protein
MQATDNCYALVQSLQANEKRYFKLFAAMQGQKTAKQYITLFDALDSLVSNDTYDEQKLKRKLKDPVIIRNLPSMKHYLVQLITRALRNYHAGKSAETQLFELLQNEQLYKERRLNDLREKTIVKAKELAYKYEKWNILLDILSREYDLHRELYHDDLLGLHKRTVEEERKIVGMIENEMEYHDLGDFLFMQLRTNAYIKDVRILKNLEQLAENELLQDEKKPKTFTSKLHFYRSLSLLARFRGDHEKSLYYQQKILQQYEENTDILENRILAYKMALNNYLSTCHRVSRYDTFENTLAKMKSLPSASFDEEGEVFQNSILFQQLFYLNTKQFDKAAGLKEDILAGLEKYKLKVNDAHKQSYFLNLAITYFILEDCQNVLAFCERIFKVHTTSRLDIKNAAKLLELVAHYELGNLFLLDSLLKNSRRKLQRDDKYFAFDKLVIAYLGKLIRAMDTAMKKMVFAEFVQKLTAMKKQTQLLCNDELIYWAMSKVQGKKLRDVIP